MTLSITYIQHNNALHYAECHYAECHHAECIIIFIVMPSIVNVIMLSVVSPFYSTGPWTLPMLLPLASDNFPIRSDRNVFETKVEQLCHNLREKEMRHKWQNQLSFFFDKKKGFWQHSSLFVSLMLLLPLLPFIQFMHERLDRVLRYKTFYSCNAIT
jgi:hypothetical protein